MLKSLKKIVSLALIGAAGFGYASEQNSWSYANAQKSPSNNTSRSDVMSAADSLGAKLSRRDAASDNSASDEYEIHFVSSSSTQGALPKRAHIRAGLIISAL